MNESVNDVANKVHILQIEMLNLTKSRLNEIDQLLLDYSKSQICESILIAFELRPSKLQLYVSLLKKLIENSHEFSDLITNYLSLVISKRPFLARICKELGIENSKYQVIDDPEILAVLNDDSSFSFSDPNRIITPQNLHFYLTGPSSTLFHLSALYSSTNVFLHLLEIGGDIHSDDGRKHTIAHFAIASGNEEIISLLREKGVDFNEPSVKRAGLMFHNNSIEFDFSFRDSFNHTLLHTCAETGNIGGALLCLQNGVNPDIQNTLGNTALHTAARKGHSDLVALLSSYADVNSRNQRKETPLHLAITPSSVASLCKSYADVDVRDIEGNSPIHIYSRDGRVGCLAELFSCAKIDANSRGANYYTALHFASQYNHPDVVSQLINHLGINVNLTLVDGTTPLHLAAYYGSIGVAKIFAESKGVNVMAKVNGEITPLHHAAGRGHAEIVRALLNNIHVVVNQPLRNGSTALQLAAGNNYPEVVKIILERPDVDADAEGGGMAPIQVAASRGYSEVIDALVGHVELNKTDENGRTALHLAARNGHIDAIRSLLKASGLEKDAADNHGWTALHWAACHGFTEIVSLLIQHSANINSVTARNSTPLHFAVSNEHNEVISFLLEQENINVSIRDIDGFSPLYYGVAYRHVETLKILFESGKFNHEEFLDGTNRAIHLAVKRGDLDIFKHVLQYVNIDSKTADGKTALEIATELSHTEMIDILSKQ